MWGVWWRHRAKIPRAVGDRVKTDRRDAEHLVRLLLAGQASCGSGAGREEEALRDLVRASERVRVDLMRWRHRLSKLLLCHGMRFADGECWSDVIANGWFTVALDVASCAGDVVGRAGRDRRALSSP